ncbi:branched-chain amino acid ABC transporter permease [Rhodobium gokarnense]|uniref:ABC-type branched-subunit amino acid transport system permease subunit n=1 Tax=Rhodobium gokarnense TaxID=364296 RepID=A0ABT3H923_9HYPH|nr:branched-chain amino acid ABC transporter permease [Rhodobium gokarnense]MCW2306896.1 ABC-type branched-subunit amino acid transport system permease subunit [Rhodobium gokarnense]
MKNTNIILASILVVIGVPVVRTIVETENQVTLIGGLVVLVAAAIALTHVPRLRAATASLGGWGEGNFALLAAGGVAVALSMFEDHFSLLMLATVLIYALAAMGLTLQFGYGGVINFAGAAFFGVGGYTAAVMSDLPVPSLIVLACGGVIAAVAGALLILPILRTAGHYAALITIAFGLLFQDFLEVNEALGGPQGLKVEAMELAGWSFNNSLAIGSFQASFFLNYALLALALLIVAMIFLNRINRSWIGLSLDMVREDETAASAFGIDTSRKRIMAFFLGNGIIGVAGALYAMMQNFIAPNNFGFGESLQLIAIVILGGLGNLWGIIPATIIIMVAPEKFQEFGEYRILIFSLIIVLILRFSPSGLFPRTMRSYSHDLERGQ